MIDKDGEKGEDVERGSSKNCAKVRRRGRRNCGGDIVR